MDGWVISFLSDSAQTENDNRNEYDSLSWSPYDRICFQDFDNFDALCSHSVATNFDQTHWLGAERIIHLYFDWDYYRNRKEDNRKNIWKLYSKNEQSANNSIIDNGYDYYCVLALRYNTNILELKNDPNNIEYEQAIRYSVYDRIYEFIDRNNLVCDYRGFRSLSVEDIVLIFSSNDLRTIYECIEFIKSIKLNNHSLFYSFSVFSGLNNMSSDKNPKMDALVKLNLRIDQNNSTNQFIDSLKREINNSSLFDSIRIEIRNNGVFILIPHKLDNGELLPILSFYVKENGIFNGSSTFYSSNIKSSRTYWILSKSSDDVVSEIIDNNIILDLSQCKTNTEEEFENISIIDKDENSVACFIVNEYDRVSQTQRFSAWKSILDDQKHIFIKLYNSYKQNNLNESICDLINCTQNALMFINQACSPIYEIPYHNNHYYSSNNDLLKMYYGIISYLLKIGYGIQHNDNTVQHPIHFAVNFESTPRIYSKMFMIKNRTPKDDSYNERFVIFFLPSDSFHRYTEMIPSLIHEVFHYIAPYDRKSRAENILRAIIIKTLLFAISESFVDFKNFLSNQQNAVQNFYLKSGIVEDVLNDTCQFMIRQNSRFFEKTISELADDYFSRFSDFDLVYKNIYISITSWIKNHLDLLKQFEDSQKSTYEKSMREEWQDLIYKKDLCKKIQDELKTSKINLKIADCFSNYNPIKNTEFVMNIHDFVNDIVTNAKEIFCDLFILKILEIDFSDYIVLFFKNLVKRSNLDDLKRVFELEDDLEINIISTDLRIFVIMEYYYNKAKLDQSKQGEWLKTQLDVARSKVDDEFKSLFESFCQYIQYTYLHTYNSYYLYIPILNKITCLNDYESFSTNNQDIQDFVQNLRESYKTDITKTIDFTRINYFTYCASTHLDLDQYFCFDNKGYYIDGYEDIANPFHNVVSSTADYIDLVNKIVRSVNNFTSCRPWFRGVCNERFLLTPSLFRKLDPKLSLYSNQARIIKYTYERSLSFNNLWSLSIVDQMSFLQHYGISTNLLDFTFNMLVALHFALNPDYPNDREAVTKGDTQAVVYIFDPIEYSKAITYLHDGLLIDVSYDFVSPIVYNFDEPLLKQYFVDDMTMEKMISHSDQYNKPYRPSPRTDLFPRPIIVQHTNERIHAQSGSFLAFSLNASPDYQSDSKHAFDYLSLSRIQEQYYQLLSSLGIKNKGTFIHKIYIDRNAVHAIRKELKTMNITEGHFYPEYSTIFRETMNDYQKFLDSSSPSSNS